MLKLNTQDDWVARARAVMPGAGFGNFDPGIIVRDGAGARVHDETGREYVDLLIGSGPMLIGHGHPEVVEAVIEQTARGMTFFANNAAGIELAEEICRALPCADQVRYVTSGGEADMYAMRLARAATGREKILKFEGGYHGMGAEAQMSLAPTHLANFPQAVPDSAGIPKAVADDVLVAPFNDAEAVERLLDEHASEIAAVIVEPLQRILPPVPGFLAALRAACDRHGIVLIFDEVVTGFRLAYGGAQEAYGVVPDLCTLGKVIGGGFPLAAIAGRADLMAHFDKGSVASDRWLMQVGTLSGMPIAAVAGLKTMEILRRDGQYERLRANGERLMADASRHLEATGLPFRISGVPAMFEVVFTDRDLRDYRDTLTADTKRATAFQDVLRQHAILKAPGKTYVSIALTEADLEQVNEGYAAAAAALL